MLERFGTAQRLGMDETFLDVTGEAKARLAQGRLPGGFLGHLQQGNQVRLGFYSNCVRYCCSSALGENPAGPVLGSDV